MIKNILPAQGKKVRSNIAPHKPIASDRPTRVVWNSYWIRRLAAQDIVVVDENYDSKIEPESVEDNLSEPESDENNVQIETSKKSKKSKKSE